MLAVMYIVLALAMMAAAAPMIMRRVRPNWVYGFRTPATVNNPDIWYPANAYAGRFLFGTGLAFLLISVLLPLLWPGIDPDAYALACTGVLLSGLALTAIFSLRYLRRLQRSRPDSEDKPR